MTAAYDESTGTVTVMPEDGIASADEDMTMYELRLALTPPQNAAYGTSYGTVSPNALGSNPNGYTLESIWNQTNDLMNDVQFAEPGDEAYVEIVGGKAYFDDELFMETYYDNDPGLTVYIDKNLTDKATLTLQMIDWRDENGEVIERQWVAVQYQPLASKVNSEIKATTNGLVVSPMLLAETEAGDYTLQVMSYPQASETGTQIHYELKLMDGNGVNVSLSELGTDVELLLPYQTEGGMNDTAVVYTVNHYNENGAIEETATEADGSVTLQRTENGVLMTVKSLSPFVLSYETCLHEDPDALTYTAKDNTITVECACGEKASMVFNVAKSCIAGNGLEFGVEIIGDWFGEEPSTSLYERDSMQSLAHMPIAPGEYVLTVRVGTATINFEFEVIGTPKLPATGDDNLPVAVLLAAALLSMTAAIALRRKVNRV